MLLYVSADAFSRADSNPDPLWQGGAAMSGTHGKHEAAQNVLYPGDLVSLTRRPLLVVCEGSCGPHFRSLVPAFGSACVVLLAPQSYPTSMHHQRVISPTFVLEQGNAFAAAR